MSAAGLGGVDLESRRNTRFQLEVPIVCRWQHNDASEELDGLTRDISTDGIFVLSPQPPPVGASVSFEATFPPLQSSAPPLRLQGHGRVLRVHDDAPEDRRGFAASAGFTLRDSDDGGTSNGS